MNQQQRNCLQDLRACTLAFQFLGAQTRQIHRGYNSVEQQGMERTATMCVEPYVQLSMGIMSLSRHGWVEHDVNFGRLRG